MFLGLFFIFVGLTKVTPRINQELHRELKREFVKYAKVIPFSKAYNIKLHSKHLRQFVGGVEISCGVALAFLPLRRMKQTANLLLLILMLYSLYTHYAVGDRFERLAPSLVFLFLLACRLVVDYQIQLRLRRSLNHPGVSASVSSAPAAQISAKAMKSD